MTNSGWVRLCGLIWIWGRVGVVRLGTDGEAWARAQKDPRTRRGSLVSGGECWLELVPDEMWERGKVFWVLGLVGLDVVVEA